MRPPLHILDRVAADHRDAPSTGLASTAPRAALLHALLAFAPAPSAPDLSSSPSSTPDPTPAFRALLDDPSAIPASPTTLGRDFALALLRVLPLPPLALLHDNSHRSAIARCIELHLSDVLPDDFPSLQGHDKLHKLAALQPEAESALRSALASLTSLDRLKAHRTQLMKTLNARLTKPFILPYLPAGFVEGALGELFARADSYVENRGGLGVVDAHRALLDGLASARSQLHACGTEYAGAIESGLVARLEKLVADDFATNRLAQPAAVRVTSTEKRYPLHAVGAELHLPLLVRNDGPGFAHDITLTLVADGPVTLLTRDIIVGRLAPLGEERVDVPFALTSPAEAVAVHLEVAWKDFDGSLRGLSMLFRVAAQRTDVDWDRARDGAPYSLEPVDASHLVGRRDVLGRLTALIKPENAGSAIVHGQKRVGKTSIARALAAECKRLGWHAVAIESGDYIDPSPTVTVQRLASRICRRLRAQIPAIESLPVPATFESLAPLSDYLEDVAERAPGKLVFLFDEFDELPRELYARDAIGNALFLTLRSLTSRPAIACVLVGGEKMRFVLESQGEKLNKWTVVSVDYFDRDTDWADYRELVQRPTADVLDFTDDAIAAIYEATAGNPYFTNLVCQTIFRTAVQLQDCHVTEVEVEQAVRATARETERNAFQHFWDDGIAEIGPDAAERSTRRRRVLIALADRLAVERPGSAGQVSRHPLAAGIDVDAELRELVTRKVLKGDVTKGLYDFKVPLFFAWLRARGIEQMVTGVDVPDASLAQRRREEELRVKPAEILELAARWGSYRGQPVTDLKIQAWLDQFPAAADQRLMLKLLQNVEFFGGALVRKKLLEIDGIVRRVAAERKGERELPHLRTVVTYLDGPAKSGAHYARLYCEESGIRPMDVVERAALRARLEADDGVRALVVIDDFVGTGGSAAKGLREMHDAVADVVRARGIKVILAAIVAHPAGWKHVQAAAEELKFGVLPHCCEMLDDSHRLFGPKSRAFPDVDERSRAQELAKVRGSLVEKTWPTGHGGLELAVVFERGCPNNTLPILWAESSTPKWMPLFKRG